MSNRIFLLSAVIGLFIAGIHNSCTTMNGKSVTYPELQVRNQQQDTTEFNQHQRLFTRYVQALEKDSLDDKSRLNLVALYINEGRASGNQSYYNTAAWRVLQPILNRKSTDPNTLYQAYVYEATVLLSLHQFADAKKVAKKALAINAYDADIYGALVDAHIELGEYAEAIACCEQMMAIRPDSRAYARASYIRQIHGDLIGAKQAMRMAVEAGVQGLENTEWARVQLGNLYLHTGHADTAKMLFESSLVVRPHYAPALMGVASVFKNSGMHDSAIAYCKQAIRVCSESSYITVLGELYEAKGDLTKSKEVHQDVLRLMIEAEEENKQAEVKHNSTRELAQAYMHAEQLDEAMQLARKDVESRPKNIDANEQMAWLYFKKKQYALAAKHMDMALQTQSKQDLLLAKAAQVYAANAEQEKASHLQELALSVNPNIAQAVID